MAMDTDELTDAVMESHDAIRALTAGCEQLGHAIGNQTQLLVDIKVAVTAEPEGPNPIIQLLQTLVELTEANAAALARIEKASAR